MGSARIAMNVLSGTAPGGAVTVIRDWSLTLKVPPPSGVKTVYSFPAWSDMVSGISPAGLTGVVSVGIVLALVTRNMKVAVQSSLLGGFSW